MKFMKYLKCLKYDDRDMQSIINTSADKVKRKYSPNLGEDENGQNESKVGETVSNIKPVKCDFKEVDIYG